MFSTPNRQAESVTRAMYVTTRIDRMFRELDVPTRPETLALRGTTVLRTYVHRQSRYCSEIWLQAGPYYFRVAVRHWPNAKQSYFPEGRPSHDRLIPRASSRLVKADAGGSESNAQKGTPRSRHAAR